MRVDVALDGEPVVGSFAVDGMTFAVTEGSGVELVGVAPDRQQATSSSEGDGSPVAPMLASEPDGLEADSSTLALPESVIYEGATYAVSSIGAYAFYLSGVTSVGLPVSIVDVDERAFRSSDVASVEVDPDNGSYASYDGILYDAGLTRLLLIPGGRTGAARISDKAEEVDARAFSHCAGVTSISVDAGSASLSSWDGLLYDASGTTLLRVPAGATDITIRDGCTAIAAGALEGCASLASITAPASVTSISPDVFTSVPTVSLPAALAVADGPGASTGATEEPSEQAGSIPASSSASTQITAMVALSSADDDLPEVDPSAITVYLPEGTDLTAWRAVGFADAIEIVEPVQLFSASTYSASYTVTIDPYWHSLYQENGIWNDTTDSKIEITWQGNTPSSGILTVYDVFWLTCAPGHLGLNSPGGDGRHNYIWFSSGTPGWTLKGFRRDVNTNEILNYVEELSGNRHFIALWEANKYTVSFDVNGGKSETNNKPSNVTATFDSTLPAINSNKPTRDGYTFGGWYDTSAATEGTQYYDANNKAVSGKTWDKAKDTTLYARWTPNTYTVEYWDKAGEKRLSSDGSFKYDSARNLAAKPTSGVSTGYAAIGWADSTNQSQAKYEFSSSQKNLATSGTKKLYLAEQPNAYAVRYCNWQGDKTIMPTDEGWVYDTSRELATAPSSGVRTGYKAIGWAKSSQQSTADYSFGSSQKNLATSGQTSLYLAEEPIEYSISYDYAGGEASSEMRAKYTIESDSFSLATPVRAGYVFDGWNVSGAGGAGTTTSGNVTTVKKGTFGNLSCTARWAPQVSADVPLEVTARVDLLGIEDQEEATGYIESRCGEPLTVADVAFEPLAGATELFGAASVADVALEVLAAGSTSPDARFALDASATQAPASAGAFRMASYGTRVPISYRFAIPDALLPSLVEVTKPVCSVAYTVALA